MSLYIGEHQKIEFSENNEYQYSWEKWNDNYQLGDSGAWYLNKSYYPKLFDYLYSIWGVITFSCLILQILISAWSRWNSLYQIEFAQTILIMITLIPSNDENLHKYASWLQFFKFDFGFLDFYELRNIQFSKLK